MARTSNADIEKRWYVERATVEACPMRDLCHVREGQQRGLIARMDQQFLFQRSKTELALKSAGQWRTAFLVVCALWAMRELIFLGGN